MEREIVYQTFLSAFSPPSTHVVVLALLPLLQIVLLGFQFDDQVPQFDGLGAQLALVEAGQVQGLDADSQGDFLLLVQLLLRLVAVQHGGHQLCRRFECVGTGRGETKIGFSTESSTVREGAKQKIKETSSEQSRLVL